MACVTSIAPADLFPAGGGGPARRVVDVRAPSEVARGEIPGALALPILTDLERHEVGLRFARDGQAAAVAEAERLTRADMPRRVSAWRRACEEAPSTFLCWRGGMRSERAQALTGDGRTPRVEGGYKAVRGYLLASVPGSLARRTTVVVTGPTGSGKTELLARVAAHPDLLALDLEAAAEHRGSSFGAMGDQPAQATFEHRLALPLLLGSERTLVLEDESRNIGRVHLPAPVYDALRSAPLLVLEDDLSARVRRIHRDYAVTAAHRHGQAAAFAELEAGILRLRRRLGARLTDTLAGALRDAHESGAWDDVDAFRAVIEPLLTEYYDPLYRKATETAARPVLARGDGEELSAWLTSDARVSLA